MFPIYSPQSGSDRCLRQGSSTPPSSFAAPGLVLNRAFAQANVNESLETATLYVTRRKALTPIPAPSPSAKDHWRGRIRRRD